MILGPSIGAFTQIHVAISLVAIATGLIALAAMLRSETPGRLTEVFLWTTVPTSVTGFLFPIGGFTPALGTGIVSMLILIPVLAAFYVGKVAGVWRPVYIIGATAALWLNCFVLVVQAFQKLPPLAELAPNQNEPPFLIAQGLVLVAFLVMGYRALHRFQAVRA